MGLLSGITDMLGLTGGGPNPRQMLKEWEGSNEVYNTARMADAIIDIGDQFRWEKSQGNWDTEAMLNNPFFTKYAGSDSGMASTLANMMNSGINTNALKEASSQYNSAAGIYSGLSSQKASMLNSSYGLAEQQSQELSNLFGSLGQGLGIIFGRNNQNQSGS